MKKVVKILAPFLALAMLLSACASTASESSSPAPETNPASKAEISGQPVEKVTLRVGMDVAPVDYAAQFTQHWVDTVEEAEVWGRENRRNAEADLIKELEDGGMTITYPDKQEFIEATSDIRASYPEYADLLGRIEAAG